MAPLALTSSSSLVPIAAADPANAVILDSDSYLTWPDMFAANSEKQNFLLTPGDYTGWGTCLIDNVGSGTLSQTEIDPVPQPWHR